MGKIVSAVNIAAYSTWFVYSARSACSVCSSCHGPVDDGIMYGLHPVVFFDGININFERPGTELNDIDILLSPGAAECCIGITTGEHAGIEANSNFG